MDARRRTVLAVVISALSFSLPATAQDRGNPSAGRTMPRTSDKRDDRKNLAVANRMAELPEFVQALRKGDARAAKRIFVAHGGSADKVILVPVVGWNPTTGYNASDPFPADVPNNPIVCVQYHMIPWYWNIKEQKYDGYMAVCWGRGRDDSWGWSTV
jgi:hypothetical protein